MSTRERWTVYPLLFLTLGIALTDKITRQVNTAQLSASQVGAAQVSADTILCKKLLVTDRSGKNEQVIISSNPGGGFVRRAATTAGSASCWDRSASWPDWCSWTPTTSRSAWGRFCT